MHQMAFPLKLASARLDPAQKRTLEDNDLQVIADLICEGLSEGLYKDIVPGRRRSDVLRFLRHLLMRCEIQHRRTAALFVHTAQGVIVGFSVLGQVVAKPIKSGFCFLHDSDYAGGTDADHWPVIPGNGFPSEPNYREKLPRQNLVSGKADETLVENGVELLMLGIVSRYRGFGYGAAILDSTIKRISNYCFNLIVRCPSDNQLFFAMLMMRGFFAVSRYCRGRILLFSPPPRDRTALRRSHNSRYSDSRTRNRL